MLPGFRHGRLLDHLGRFAGLPFGEQGEDGTAEQDQDVIQSGDSDLDDSDLDKSDLDKSDLDEDDVKLSVDQVSNQTGVPASQIIDDLEL